MEGHEIAAKIGNSEPDMACRGIVYNLQRYTVHDGPGTRTQVFLKGCTMSCVWCCNPESLVKQQEIGVYPQRCIGVDKCGFCLKACQFTDQGIFQIDDKGLVVCVDRALCTHCLACAEECPANALVVWGDEMSVEQVIREIRKDREFFDMTGGGVTISGGELFVQARFALELLKACKKEGLHTCIETALGVPWNLVEQALPYVDFVLTDIKHMEPEKFREYTGCSLKLVLDNLGRLAKSGVETIIRIPLVPGHNDSEENIHLTGRFIAEQYGRNLQQVQVLQFHELGKAKYQTLGMSYPLENMNKPSREDYVADLKNAVTILRGYGLPAYIGTNVKMTQ